MALVVRVVPVGDRVEAAQQVLDRPSQAGLLSLRQALAVLNARRLRERRRAEVRGGLRDPCERDQSMLRHSSLAITADSHTSLFADEGHEVAEAIANVVPRKAVAGGPSETPGPVKFGPSRASEGSPVNQVIKDYLGQRGGASGARTRNLRIKSRAQRLRSRLNVSGPRMGAGAMISALLVACKMVRPRCCSGCCFRVALDGNPHCQLGNWSDSTRPTG